MSAEPPEAGRSASGGRITGSGSGANGRAPVAYKGADNDTNIYYTSFDGSTWAPAAQLTTGLGAVIGASLAVFKNLLYAAWRTVPFSGGLQQELNFSWTDGSQWLPVGELIPGTLHTSPPPPPPSPTGQHVYTIAVDVDAFLLGGSLNIHFYPYGSTPGGTPLVTFKGAFGGIIAPGSGLAWGTAWLNYDVEWLAQQGWNARFEVNFVPAAVNVNLWGLSGENIGNTVSGGESGLLGIAGGQGFLLSRRVNGDGENR